MRRHESYKLIAKATYKDYQPIKFALDVRYLPNLDGRVKFADLGTHVFYKENERPQSPYVFYLTNVLDNVDNGKNDDYDNYKFLLNDGIRDYFELDDQENEIQIPAADSRDVPRIGENIATVSSNDLAF